MYTAKQIGEPKYDKANQNIAVTVQFLKDGVPDFTKVFMFAPLAPVEHRNMKIKAHIKEVEAAEANLLNYTEGDIDLSNVSIDPAPEVLERQAFFNELQEAEYLAKVDEIVGGLPVPKQKRLNDLKTNLKANFKPEFCRSN